MTEALQQLLDDEIAGIERQPELWENNYLVKLRQFVKEVDEFPEDSANYPYKAAVVGTPTSTDPVAKEELSIVFGER